MQNAPFFVDNEVIELTADGVWIADGIEISHDPTRELFARSLKWSDKDKYYLHIGRETKTIDVKDTAYFVQRIDGNPEDGFEVLINDRITERLKPETLRFRPGRLTCRIQRQGRSEEAKFLRSAYMDLLRHLQQDERGYFLTLQNQRIHLG